MLIWEGLESYLHLGCGHNKTKKQAQAEAKVKASKSLCDMELGGLKLPVWEGLAPLMPVCGTMKLGLRTAAVIVTHFSCRGDL